MRCCGKEFGFYSVWNREITDEPGLRFALQNSLEVLKSSGSPGWKKGDKSQPSERRMVGGCGQDGNRGGDEQLIFLVLFGHGRWVGIKHCFFLGGGARKVPFTTLGKAVRSHEKSSTLTSLTSCWVPRTLFRREKGRGV